MTLKSVILFTLLSFFSTSNFGQINLLIRGDDAGSTRSANLAIVDNYKNGILRTAEVMVTCPWFNEAVEMLKQHPGLDVGVHLTITSEWEGYKWRPLTHCPTLCDSVGNFLKNTWGGAPGNSLLYAKINLKELEAELRAQIETAKKQIPQLSHVSEHMVYGSLSPEIRSITQKMAAEYGLLYEGDIFNNGVKVMKVQQSKDYKTLKKNFINSIKSLTSGTWIWIEHPAMDGYETQGLKLSLNSKSVAVARNNIYLLFKDSDVKKAIKTKNVELIGYNN